MKKFHTPMQRHQLSTLGILVVVLVLLVGIFVNRDSLFDWWRLRNYTPPLAVTQLANEDTMTSYTRHMLYVNHPQLLNTIATFRQACPEDQQDIVLGCYHQGQNGIFIYDVQDPQLPGVQQVTAAHEVLHAVYARLSSQARTQLNRQLEDYQQHGLTDPRVIAEVKIYQRTEPNDVDDEMSCTFGTELASLPAGLEAYYRQYFSDRSAIVAYEQQYVNAFSSRQAQVASDDQALTSLKQQITSGEAALKDEQAQVDSQRVSLQSLESVNPAAYNAAVPSFNSLIARYNAQANGIQADITQYNQLVSSRNAIAGALAGLDKAIDTRLSPQVQSQ
jgi:hypothetical protein